jgi:hypothetical protein
MSANDLFAHSPRKPDSMTLGLFVYQNWLTCFTVISTESTKC